MSNRKVFIPSDLIAELKEIVSREAYTALSPLFENVDAQTEYLDMDENDARNMLRLADIEMTRALLRYPHNEEDDPLHDPEHEARYDDVMMGIYEKTYYYIRSTFADL
jgi:hypothetical protein